MAYPWLKARNVHLHESTRLCIFGFSGSLLTFFSSPFIALRGIAGGRDFAVQQSWGATLREKRAIREGREEEARGDGVPELPPTMLKDTGFG